MQIAHNIEIPGVTMMGTEFVIMPDGSLKVMHNTVQVKFYQLPEYVRNSIKKDMGNPYASMEEMEAHAFKTWGGMDFKIDIDVNGVPSKPEYISGVNDAYYDNGNKISPAQLRVIELVHLNNAQDIADVLFISRKTVDRHLQDIYAETGFANRTQLALWAMAEGIRTTKTIN